MKRLGQATQQKLAEPRFRTGMGNWEAKSCSFSHAVSQWPPRGHGPISQMRTSEEEISGLCNAIVS